MAENDYEYTYGNNLSNDLRADDEDSSHKDPGVRVGEFVRALQESMGSSEVHLERWEFHRDNTIYDIYVRVRSVHQGETKAPEILENTAFFQVVRHIPDKQPVTCHQSLTAFMDGEEALVRVHFVCEGTEIRFVRTRTFEKTTETTKTYLTPLAPY